MHNNSSFYPPPIRRAYVTQTPLSPFPFNGQNGTDGHPSSSSSSSNTDTNTSAYYSSHPLNPPLLRFMLYSE